MGYLSRLRTTTWDPLNLPWTLDYNSAGAPTRSAPVAKLYLTTDSKSTSTFGPHEVTSPHPVTHHLLAIKVIDYSLYRRGVHTTQGIDPDSEWNYILYIRISGDITQVQQSIWQHLIRRDECHQVCYAMTLTVSLPVEQLQWTNLPKYYTTIHRIWSQTPNIPVLMGKASINVIDS